jgi:putative Mn2+ efflux pump MntP
MWFEIVLFSLVLSIDSFSAAFALGFRRFSIKRAFAFALSSAVAEGLATAIGFALGKFARNLIVDYDHWVAFVLLVLVGIHMCHEAYQNHKSDQPIEEAQSHGFGKILFVSTATSIDSMGVGVSLGLTSKPILTYSIAIGAGAFIATYLGLFFAKRISAGIGSRLEIMGGIVLILLGFKMLTI